ncbi:MAG: tRNA epoxyqueuosine(34) reductase QueG [Flavobacteriaceae bacterium]|nr:tRNA epoxyqueuosine(34) reductase QueG [Flavobacteriaceae bacterium]MBT5650583.1 tRNA epoxyqueuosine(34) reductase QueG [Flavobacteriaceae bacterium]MBT7881024.1 tRNA epoxyqueuosine(34) reductase QueG [Flavobacteriaceae bacterium]
MKNKKHYTELIKNEAKRLGFISCGVSRAEFLEDEAPRLEKWLKNNMHGEMKYMENYFEKRLDPSKLVDDAKSVISLSYNYYPKDLQNKEAPKVSKYAYGIDYHYVIKEKLIFFLSFIKDKIGDVNGRAFVDSAPILEKAWASKSGIAWVGKNSNLITKQVGSFYFLAELIIDLELDYDGIESDHCGECTACIDSCPTQAIVEPYVVDGSKCISYFTIELKENIPNEFKAKFEDWVFGCDICQDVCPWNKFSKPHKEPLFQSTPELMKMSREEWNEITEETFNKIFKNSAVKRTGYKGLTRNLNFIKSA